MIVTRTEQIQFSKNDLVSATCHVAKDLYNYANYIIRQEFITNGKWIQYFELCKLVQESEQYKALPSQTSQQTLKLLDKNWKSFFKATKEYGKHPDKFLGRPRLPNYKPKNGESIVIFTNQQCKLKGGLLKFPKRLPFEFKTGLNENEIKLCQVRIIPNQTHYVCEVVYEKEVPDCSVESERIIGIDPGTRNIVTIANNFGNIPIVVKGGAVKSINQYYNKEKARVQSIYDLQNVYYGKKLAKLDRKRNNKVKDYFHQLSRRIINYAVENNVGLIVIGRNKNWKQEANLGKRNNQNFVQIPFMQLVEKIQYKAEEYGIKVVLNEESYTSKCSFLDNEKIEKHEEYAGKRVKRGIFKAHSGVSIHADVNGALNIIRKAVPDAFANGIEGVRLHPKRDFLIPFKVSSSKTTQFRKTGKFCQGS